MSEDIGSGVTAGGLLRQAREACGMHIAALAVVLKVPVGKLEALEADDYDALPDTVFVRALASSVCRTLKVDAAPVLSRLPQHLNPRLSVHGAGLNAPVKASSTSAFPGSASRSVALVVVALLLGALLLFFYPRQRHADSEVAVDAPTDAPAALPASAAQEASAAVVAEPPAEGMSGATAAGPAAALPASDAASAALAPALVLHAQGEVWVRVQDATGVLAVQRNLAAGESVTITAPTPLAVVIGRANAVQVMVHGKAFDLAALARDNVARFEVK